MYASRGSFVLLPDLVGSFFGTRPIFFSTGQQVLNLLVEAVPIGGIGTGGCSNGFQLVKYSLCRAGSLLLLSRIFDQVFNFVFTRILEEGI